MGSIYRQKGRAKWLIKYYRDGRPVIESTGTDDHDEAKSILKRREGAVADGVPLTTKIGQARFKDAADDLINDYTINHRRSLDEVTRRVNKHLIPYFGNRKLATISADVVRAFVMKRKADVFIVRKAVTRTTSTGEVIEVTPAVTKHPSNAEINRELTCIKRIFSLAIQCGKMAYKPHIGMLKENNVRTGFFELPQFKAVRSHLPAELRPVLTCAYITGWRIASEILPLEWSQVNFDERLTPGQQVPGTLRLNVGTTKNGEGRVFPFTPALRAVFLAQRVEHQKLKKAGHIAPWVFFRMIAEGRGGKKRPLPILRFDKAWKAACVAAGAPGRIPHDCRRTAVRNLVRAGIPERVAMQLTGHKTRSVFERYNIVSDGDLASAATLLGAQSSQQLRA